MNFTLSDLAEKCKRIPLGGKKIVSWVIGRVVPYVGHSGLEFVELSPHKVVVSVENKFFVRNHIKQVHAMAGALAIETATGFVVNMNLSPKKLPLLKHMSLDYVKRSQGKVTATATLSDEQIALIKREMRADLEVAVEVVDESGKAPIVAKVIWAFVPKREKDK